jgi:type IV pilus assembly protein PilW
MEMLIRQHGNIRMRPYHQTGFTLIEILVALLMSGIIMGAIYTTSEKQQDVFVKQDEVLGAQNNLRAAMLLMAKEIRMAGYDPTGSAGATITNATSSSLSFTMDNNGDGNTTDSGENITYSLYTESVDDHTVKLGRKNPTQNMPVAENITSLEFYYTMADGTQTLTPAAPLANIRAIEVTALARSEDTVGSDTGTTTMTTPGGQTWPMANNYLWRSQSLTIECRNMGL